MRIQTFSILAGSEACNARCPDCISKMTPPEGMKLAEPKVNWRNFRIACLYAKQRGATTAMLTGKGEPTLFPGQITKFLKAMRKFEFPLVEMQTNGIMLMEKPSVYAKHLRDWYRLGMTTIAVSVVHHDAEANRGFYVPYKKEYISIPELVKVLHGHGFSVRLTCTLIRGYVDDREKLEALIEFAREHKIEQLTVTPVNKPDAKPRKKEELKVWDWTEEHQLTEAQKGDIASFLEDRGSRTMRLVHGAVVYDVAGQNVCFNNCLSVNPDSEELRNIIFFPDGHVRQYWQYPGSIIL